MARRGQAENSEEGKMYMGDKDIQYLEDQSRQAVEEHHNLPILYLEVDWENSQKNIYGEIKLKKFKDAAGVQVRGQINLSQQDQKKDQDMVTNKMMLTFSVY